MTSRDETISLLRGQPLSRLPVFSGLPSLTASGLSQAGVRYVDAHKDAAQMARAAASTFELFGFESAVVPFDLCVEAEAVGGGVDFRTDADTYLAPVVNAPLALDETYERLAVLHEIDIARAGRIPIIAEAIVYLRSGVGRQICIGACLPGPFTLAWQLFGGDTWLLSIKDVERTSTLLNTLASLLTRVGIHYREAGADFLTVHEMGGSPQVIGARRVREVVLPGLVRLFTALPPPRVLSMCGDTNEVMADLALCGADAVSVDQRNHVARSRQDLGRSAALYGNLDPVGLLSRGSPEAVAQAVRDIAPHVSAIWPGCDLWPEIPVENFQALMDTARSWVANRV
jgi:[methyl-Co(III) methanol-specific corrinoid protein]:coenzyme M methyltransferase